MLSNTSNSAVAAVAACTSQYVNLDTTALLAIITDVSYGIAAQALKITYAKCHNGIRALHV